MKRACLIEKIRKDDQSHASLASLNPSGFIRPDNNNFTRMKLKAIKSLVVATLLLSIPNLLLANDYDKKISKTYTVSKGSSLEVINKYGNVDVNNWDKNEVQLEIQIIVKDSKESTAKQLLEYINVEFTETGQAIKAVTVIDPKFSDSQDGIFKFNSDRDYSINYVINAPEWLDVNIKNSYGNIFVNKLSGHARLWVRYGTLRVHSLTRGDIEPYNQINLEYTGKDAQIDECNWAKVDMKYSKLSIVKARAIVMVSKYSGFEVQEINSLVSESKYDSYSIGVLSNLSMSTGYSKLKINQLREKFELESKYSSTSVDFIPSGFSLIQIENRYGSVKLGIDRSASYKLKGSANYSDINFPSSDKVNRISESNSLEVSGTVGDNEATKSRVQIDTKYGNVTLY